MTDSDSGDEEIDRFLDALEIGEVRGNYYKPLTDAAQEYKTFAETPQLRVHTGLQEFDEHIRGVAPGELCLIQGFSHSGKTVLATEIMLNNSDTPMVLFTPDESRMAVLAKITTAITGIPAEDMERMLERQDAAAMERLLQVADEYHELAVYEEHVTLGMMSSMFKEAETAFGKKPRAVLFDFAKQLNEEGDEGSKIAMLKQWGKAHGVAMFVLHQASRGSGAGGRELGLSGGAYGGETDANFIINVRRKSDYYNDQLRLIAERLDQTTNPQATERYLSLQLDIRDNLLPRHRDTISIGMPKNKRLPCTKVPEHDYKLDPETGRIVNLPKDDEDQLPDLPLPEMSYQRSGTAVDLLKGVQR